MEGHSNPDLLHVLVETRLVRSDMFYGGVVPVDGSLPNVQGEQDCLRNALLGGRNIRKLARLQ